MKTSNSFYLISKSLDKVFQGKYNLLRQLIEYMELYSLWKFQNRLQEDGSFFCSDNFISKKLGFSRCTVLRNRKELKEKGYIDFYSRQKEGSATYIIINLAKIDEIQNLDNKEIINDYEDQKTDEAPEMVVSKNATTEQEELPIVKESVNEYKEKIMNAWNIIADKHGLSRIIMIKDDRLKKFKSAISYLGMTEKEFFNAIHVALSESKFLRGVGKKWKASFDFFLSKQKVLKSIEGGYKDNPNEFLERLSDVETMTYSEAREARKDIALKQWEEKYRKIEKEQKLIGDNENDKN